jgi:hypothetical protein
MYDQSLYSDDISLTLVFPGTGVAFCNVPAGEQAPRCINHWPGSGRDVVNKVRLEDDS